MKPLIISADDYAQSPEIDDGIIALIKRGRLTAASCLTMSPRWLLAAGRLDSEIRQQADIGLHLDFTQFGTYRYSLPLLIARTLGRSLTTRRIHSSIHQQLDRFEQGLGTAPDYVDGHQHVHQLPQLREALLEVLAQRYSGNLPWLRIAAPPHEDGLKASIIKRLGSTQLRAQATQYGFKCTGQLLGVYGFDLGNEDYLARMHAWLAITQRTSGVDALMCHPAIKRGNTLAKETKDSGVSGASHGQNQDPIYTARLSEYEVFESTAFATILHQYQLTLARGSRVLS